MSRGQSWGYSRQWPPITLCLTSRLLYSWYGMVPREKISHTTTPYDHTSPTGVNNYVCRVSEDIHRTGMEPIASIDIPSERHIPKSPTLTTRGLLTRQFQVARSQWMWPCDTTCSIPMATCRHILISSDDSQQPLGMRQAPLPGPAGRS